MPEQISDNPEIQARYEKMIRNGVSPKLAEMFALQKAPQSLTDRELFQGYGPLESQFAGDPIGLAQVVRTAKRHGYKPNANDVYIAPLARFPGDPQAFVPPTGGRGYIKKLCEQRGWACDGVVKVKAKPLDKEPESIPLAKDIVDEEVNARIQRNPDLKKKPRKELEAQVIEEHGSKD